GPRAGDQAAHVDRDLRAADDVVSGQQQYPIPPDRRERRDATGLPARFRGRDFARASRGHAQGLGVLAGSHSRAGGKQSAKGQITMSACCCADRKTSGPMRRVKSILAWLLPSAVLVLMPKCP